jgi:xanthine dehydrogenase YagS FAD-binding subunit
LQGYNRIHAILGASDACIAVHPSDMAVAMMALDAEVEVQGPRSNRRIKIADFHRLPGNTPQTDTNLGAEELITAVILPPPTAGGQVYRKVRDRASFDFALVSVAAVVETDGEKVRSARIALGGVAHKPWRDTGAEAALRGQPPNRTAFAQAAELVLRGAKAQSHNAFKIDLARRTIIRALTQAAQATPQIQSIKKVR